MTNDSSATRRPDTAWLDIDGTLIDSVFAHVWSWQEAFRVLGTDVPAWRVHRAIAMGGDRLVGALTSEAVESEIGDEVRSWQKTLYRDLAEHLAPTHGALDLLEAFRMHGLAVVLASSGAREDTDHAVDVLEARRGIASTVSAVDVFEDPAELASVLGEVLDRMH